MQENKTKRTKREPRLLVSGHRITIIDPPPQASQGRRRRKRSNEPAKVNFDFDEHGSNFFHTRYNIRLS